MPVNWESSSDGRQSAPGRAPAAADALPAEEGDVGMYGTIARMRPKAGHEQEVLDLMEQWNRERKPNVRGAVGGYNAQARSRPAGGSAHGCLRQSRDVSGERGR